MRHKRGGLLNVGHQRVKHRARRRGSLQRAIRQLRDLGRGSPAVFGQFADLLRHHSKAAAMLAQVDPVEYGLLKRKPDGSHALEALTAEQWSAHLGDMNWPYTLGAAHPTGKAFLQKLAVEDYGISEADVKQFPYTRAFNQLKNYVWSQVGEIGLYEVLQREGDDAARRFVNRLVTPV